MGVLAVYSAIATGASYAAGAGVAYEAYKGIAGKGGAPKLPNAPQAAQSPDANTDITKNAGAGQAGGNPGVAQTFLTGPGGVDPSLLNLGKSTLLGGGAPTGG